METGSHDRFEEDSSLSLELTNGVIRHPSGTHEEGGVGLGPQREPQRSGSVPPEQGWVPGHEKASHAQQQLPCSGWSSTGRTPGKPVNEADMEDARNLVAFSASVGSLPLHPEPQSQTAQLYEKFNQEMGTAEGATAQARFQAPEGGDPTEDVNTLRTALNQARHGHKPPNCDCEGPECPDYLEWLEKRIRQAGAVENKDNNAPCSKMVADTPPHQQPAQPTQPHPHHHTYPPGSVSNPPSCPPLHPHQQGRQPGSVPFSPAPIPCSPQVLSIAKEKNISLQAAIAIEALTQLSAPVPQTPVPPAHQHPSPHPQHGTRPVPSSADAFSYSSSSRSQSVPPGLFPQAQQSPASWEQQHRPQSQGQPVHASPLPGLPQVGSPRPQSQQGPGGAPEQRNQWTVINSDSQQSLLAAPSGSHSAGDPMSELKQLLGDCSGNGPFKLPVLHHHIKQEPGVPRIKQEVDSGDYQSPACASIGGHYGLMNGQQQNSGYSGPPLSPATHTALQQHLHHRRNLFPSAGIPGLCPSRPSQVCQNLRKWWPQNMGPDGHPVMVIKQESKEPKRRKSSVGVSPLTKEHPVGGMLLHSGFKSKPIVIKKTKQKASLPTFLPQSQISIQKRSPLILNASVPLANPGSLSFSTFPPISPTQAVAGLPAPAQSQVSILSSSAAASVSTPAFSVNTPAVSTPQPLPAAPASSGDAIATQTSTTSQSIPGLSSLDPKFEELIRQFEAEFGDTLAPDPCSQVQGQPQDLVPSAQPQDLVPSAQPQGQVPAAQPLVTESQPHVNSGQARPASPTASTRSSGPAPSAPTAATPADQEVELDKESGGESKPTSDSAPQPSAESPVEELREEAQQQHVLPDPFTAPPTHSPSSLPKRMKIETNGNVTVLSTTGLFSEEEDSTPTKDSFPINPSLKGFLESPLRYLDTPTKSLLDTPAKDLQAEFPTCDCVEQVLEKDEGPYYNHLGSGPSVASIRELMETRYGEKGEAIRIEKVVYTGREGKSSQGCPIAKWVIRRASEKEKLLCLVRPRVGHRCANSVIIILIMAWEGVPRALGDKLYREISDTLTKFGNPTNRRCGLNDDRTCACQGKDPDSSGASFSFGCSWSMYFNGCKYARSKTPRKFRLAGDHPQEEDLLRDNFQDLATELAPLYMRLAPQAYSNQCKNEALATDCRLGLKDGRPFSGVTACMDFCAHAHKDQHNLYNGCTVVCTLTKEDNRRIGEIPEDEQLHVLPLYKAALTDEFGSEEGQRQKMCNGAIQVLNSFRREVRKLPEPAKSCRQRRLDAKNRASEKKKGKQQLPTETPEKTVINMEVRHTGSPVRQHGNKAIPKQEMKPIMKKEQVDQRLQPFNGQLEGYPAQAADPYHVYPPHPGYYIRRNFPPNGQPSALPSSPGPVNGYHPNLPGALPYSYYNYTLKSNALFPHELTYEGRNSPWHQDGPKVPSGPVDKKPDAPSLQAKLALPYPGHTKQQHGDLANQHHRSAYPHPQQSDYNQSRPSSVSSEPSHRGTPIIKQEPMDMPVYEGGNAHPQSCPSTPSNTPQPGAAGGSWPGHKPNGSMVLSSWDGNPKPATPLDARFTPDKQQFHQQGPYQPSQSLYPPQQPSPSLYPPQQPSLYPQQWRSYPGPNTPRASPAPSPSLKVPPSPSPSTQPSTPCHWDSPAPSPQPKTWPIGMVPAGYSPAGGFPDKMWSKANESRGTTPLGLQEKAWKSSGGSMAGTPSPAPEGRQFPDALQPSDGQPQACWDPNRAQTPSEPNSQRNQDLGEEEQWSDSEHNFLDPNIGGVAVAPAHGSILIECARRELHATTPLKKPDRSHPTRISLVFYQHKNMNQPCHGQWLWEAKMKMLAERARERQQEAALLGLPYEDIKPGKKRKLGAMAAGASPGPGPTTDKRVGPVTRLAPTQHTASMVTVSPYAFTTLTGPYSHFV